MPFFAPLGISPLCPACVPSETRRPDDGASSEEQACFFWLSSREDNIRKYMEKRFPGETGESAGFVNCIENVSLSFYIIVR